MTNTKNSTHSVTISNKTVIDLTVSSQSDMENIVEAFQKGFATISNGEAQKREALRVASRDALDKNLGAYFGIAQAMLDPANATFTLAVLTAHGLRPARKGTNQYRPFADLLFGEWEEVKAGKNPTAGRATKKVGDRTLQFVPNRSAEKYAKVARHAADKNIVPAELAKYIAGFKNRMEGIMAADTKAYEATDVDVIELAANIQEVLASPAIHKLDREQAGIASDCGQKLVALWAEYKASGEVLIRGFLPVGEGALEAHLAKVAKVSGPKLKMERLERENEALRAQQAGEGNAGDSSDDFAKWAA